MNDKVLLSKSLMVFATSAISDVVKYLLRRFQSDNKPYSNTLFTIKGLFLLRDNVLISTSQKRCFENRLKSQVIFLIVGAIPFVKFTIIY